MWLKSLMFARVAAYKWSRLGFALVFAMLFVPFGSVASADDVFFACEKNGKVIPGSVMVNQEPNCRGRKNLVSWNAGPPAEPKFESCVGTYFVQRFFRSADSGGELAYSSDAFWTFSGDGTFQGTSSNELEVDSFQVDPFPFSHKQGAWTATDDYTAKMVNLDFEFGEDIVARNDAVVTFENDCSAFEAEFEFRVYDARSGTPLGEPPPWIPGEDPLDPNQGTPNSFEPYYASGRLLTTP